MKKFRKLAIYKQILFTCPTSVEIFFKGLSIYGIDIRTISAQFFVTIGKTELALKKYGCASKYDRELSLRKSLLIVGAKTSNTPQATMNKRLDYLPTHRNILVNQSLQTLIRLETEQMVNTVVFTSQNSVSQLLAGLKEADIDRSVFFNNKTIVALDEKSAAALGRAGLPVKHNLKEPTVDDLIKALVNEEVHV